MSMYLDIMNPPIPGESKSPNTSWNQKIETATMGYSITQKTSVQAGSGLISSGAVVSHLHITKTMDKSTPILFGKLCGGEPIDSMVLRVSRPGGAQAASALGVGGLFEAETYTLQNVIVTGYHTSGKPGPGGLPLETWGFAFTKDTETYKTVDTQGNLQAQQTQQWNFATNSNVMG